MLWKLMLTGQVGLLYVVAVGGGGGGRERKRERKRERGEGGGGGERGSEGERYYV